MPQQTIKLETIALTVGLAACMGLVPPVLAAGSTGSTGSNKSAGAAQANDNEIHAAGISLTVPATLGPTGGDADAAQLIAPGPITPFPSSLPAINPSSLPPAATGSAPANSRPEVQFYSPEDPLDVPTKFGTLHVLPGSLVLAISGEDALSVYDLHDGSASAVYVMADKERFALTPGKHITLARPQCTNFAAVNKLPFVAYMSADFQPLNNGLVCFHGSYDINSLICRFAPFKTLLTSKEPKVRRVAEKVLKTSAIMNQLAATARYYQVQTKPAQAAQPTVTK